ncbi:MAG: Uma2 family endonuclease [Myxococcales bacterium]|nr:Uma2 family endonuclease [Myxococcales bacterium]
MQSTGRAQRVGVRYDVPRVHDGWELREETMPESVTHDHAVEVLKALLAAWSARAGASTGRPFVARNLAVRWDEARPAVGVDPDVCVLSPAPPDARDLRSVRTWLPENAPPLLAVEVVSESDPRKDYVTAPDKYAASGTRELWVFDPLLAGPTSHGGPFRIQVWTRDELGDLVRVYAGNGPARSDVLGAYLVATDDGRVLRIADDAAGTRMWRTAEEAEREEKETALARVAELEAQLARR